MFEPGAPATGSNTASSTLTLPSSRAEGSLRSGCSSGYKNHGSCCFGIVRMRFIALATKFIGLHSLKPLVLFTAWGP